jgi:hypothetical protein
MSNTLEPIPAGDGQLTRWVQSAGRFAVLPAAAAVGVAATGHMPSPEAIQAVKDIGIPAILLLAGGATLKSWIEAAAAFIAPQVREVVAQLGAIAHATSENAKIASASAIYLTEADQQAQRERADTIDAVRDGSTVAKVEHAAILLELHAIKARLEQVATRLEAEAAPISLSKS